MADRIRRATELKISVRDDQEIHYQIANQCVELCRSLHIPPARFALGSSGEGGGLPSIFRREWGPVVGIEEAGKVSDRPVSAVNPKPASEEYDRVVSELHFAVRSMRPSDPRSAPASPSLRKTIFNRASSSSASARVLKKMRLRFPLTR